MNVNMLPAYILGALFALATIHLAVECVLGVRRWWLARMAEPLTTYTLVAVDGTYTDITRADRDALIQQGYDEIDTAWDDEIDQAIALTQPRPDYGPVLDIIAANEAARNLTDDRLRAWVEGAR